jgi:hypothetical protein
VLKSPNVAAETRPPGGRAPMEGRGGYLNLNLHQAPDGADLSLAGLGSLGGEAWEPR